MPAGFSRWLVPPAALCVHLCIGQAYAFSVFNLPLTRLIGITQSAPDDWKLTDSAGSSASRSSSSGCRRPCFGRWVEEGGPRKAMFTAGAVLGGGFLVSALGVYVHKIWLVYLGYGVLGGIGLGLGYISPVSTLIRWFPDRPGMATGMAIMGFGGGAIIASPLSVWLMRQFSTDDPCRRRRDLRRARRHLSLLHDGRRRDRAPAAAGLDAGGLRRRRQSRASSSPHSNVFVYQALKTPQFWLIWLVLCLNVTAGIGVLGQASAMSQEMFPGKVTVTAAAGFVGLLSLFNMGGRFFWASVSDYHRPQEHLLRVLLPGRAALFAGAADRRVGSVALFVLCFCVIMSMYGGGFATMPAYLRDMFGTRYVGAIHGRLLTAWSMAGIFGPVLVNYIRQYKIEHGVAKAEAYNVTMYIMAALLVVGFFCNLFIQAVHERHHMRHEEADAMGMAD